MLLFDYDRRNCFLQSGQPRADWWSRGLGIVRKLCVQYCVGVRKDSSRRKDIALLMDKTWIHSLSLCQSLLKFPPNFVVTQEDRLSQALDTLTIILEASHFKLQLLEHLKFCGIGVESVVFMTEFSKLFQWCLQRFVKCEGFNFCIDN